MDKREQTRLILKRVEKWAGGSEVAKNWFDDEFIPALGCTPKQAIELGHYEALNDYLDVIGFGGFA
jgi:hypothetical protein